MKEITIGRSENCDIRLDSRCGYASNVHGTIVYDGRKLMYKDTSSNGTYINNVRVHNREVPLHRGDIIMIAGRYQIKWNHIDPFFRDLPSHSNVPASPSLVKDPVVAEDTPTPSVDSVPVIEQPQRPSVAPAPVKEPQKPQKPQAVSGGTAPRLNKWSWGAFVLSWIWGLFNGCWWMLLVDIGLFVLMIITSITFILPILFAAIGFGLSIWFGIKGRQWAWENHTWDSAESFEHAQKVWDTVGIVLLVILLLSPILIPLIGLSILSSFLPF